MGLVKSRGITSNRENPLHCYIHNDKEEASASCLPILVASVVARYIIKNSQEEYIIQRIFKGNDSGQLFS